MKRLVDFNAEKIQLVSFDRSNNTDAVDVEMDVSVLEEIDGDVFLFYIGLGLLQYFYS